MSNILHALSQMDPADDAQWTADGSPLMDTVKELAQDDTITRKQTIDAAPLFSRESLELPEPYNLKNMAGDTVAGDEEVASASPGDEPIVAPTEPQEPAIISGSGAEDEDEAAPAADDAPTSAPEPAVADVVRENLAGRTVKEAYQEEYELCSTKIAELQKERSAIDEELKQLAVRQNQLDPFVTKTTDYDHKEDMKGRKAYILSQNKIRAERHAAHGKVLAALGVKTSAASPIDQAMARKTARGLQRPTR